MAKKNNVAAIDHVKLQQIKSDSKTMSITKLAGTYGIGYAAAKNAVEARNLKDFKERMAAYNAAEAKKNAERRKAKTQNQASVKKTAEQIVSNAKQTYSKREVKTLIDGILRHTASLEERMQTMVSLLIESDDNVVSRIYKLENKKGRVRRFLERF
jgi:transposase